jgi:chemotaxis protein CheD
MSNIVVGIGDYKITKDGALLESFSLGSCVGIALIDPVNRVAGLAHIMMPSSTASASKNFKVAPNKFADTAIRLMIEEMVKLGAVKHRLVAKIAGGACMFQSAMPDNLMNIGTKNVEAVKKILEEDNIRILAEDTGKNHGRTICFNPGTGKLSVKSASAGSLDL